MWPWIVFQHLWVVFLSFLSQHMNWGIQVFKTLHLCASPVWGMRRYGLCGPTMKVSESKHHSLFNKFQFWSSYYPPIKRPLECQVGKKAKECERCDWQSDVAVQCRSHSLFCNRPQQGDKAAERATREYHGLIHLVVQKLSAALPCW